MRGCCLSPPRWSGCTIILSLCVCRNASTGAEWAREAKLELSSKPFITLSVGSYAECSATALDFAKAGYVVSVLPKDIDPCASANMALCSVNTVHFQGGQGSLVVACELSKLLQAITILDQKSAVGTSWTQVAKQVFAVYECSLSCMCVHSMHRCCVLSVVPTRQHSQSAGAAGASFGAPACVSISLTLQHSPTAV